MDSQRPFLYLALLFLGFLLWTTWQADNAPKPPPAAVSNNGIGAANPAQTAQGEVPTASSVPVAPGTTLPNASVVPQNNQAQIIRVRTDVLDVQISTQGGEVIVADLPTYSVSLEEPDNPTRIISRDEKNYVAQSGLLHQGVSGQDVSKLAPNHLSVFSAEKTEYTLEAGEDTLIVPLVWQQNGVTVTKRYYFKRGQFNIDLEHEVANRSAQPWTGLEYRQLKHGPAEARGGLLSGVQAFVGGAYYLDEKYETIHFVDMGEDNLSGSAQGGWVSFLQHYFISAWIPPQQEKNTYYSKETSNLGVPAYILGMQGPLVQVASGSSQRFSKSQLWVGPKLQDDLEILADGLDLTVDYGIFAFISKPLFWVMQTIHSVVQNWGWTIIFLTIFVKAVFFWPSAASYKSMAKMKAVAPRLKEIGERYAKDPQAKQKAMMDIYKKEKINPLGGCLPILIQIPVFMGLYWVLLESVELRQAPWMLWYKDLSIRDPYFILPLIMGASMYLQQKLNPPQMDPMQQKIFQFLPIVFTGMFLFFPAGLVLYWVVNNILSIAQQWFINKKIIGHG